jgi:predicted SAM-dependent methyltransferase
MNPLAKKLRVAVLHPSIVRTHVREIALEQFQALLARRGYEMRYARGDQQSETSKCRARLAPFCVGYGLDVGAGGDPISESAVRVDLPHPYARTGIHPVQLGGDARCLHWFANGTLDYVYSSHLLEDFEDTKSVLVEWLRVLRRGGRLVLFCPDQRTYEAYCRGRGEGTNPHHAHSDFSLQKVQNILKEIGLTNEIHSHDLVDVYSWELVVEKL